jgi:UDP-N-acetylmuramoylalanine--D-glutamate ligase
VRVGPVAEVRLPGVHNLSNVLAAVAVGLLFGLEPTAIRGAVAGFEGVEHRLETVALTGRVRFVNDSQGTQPDAVIAALRAFPAPVVLIAGGRDKGVDLSDLARVVGERAHAAVLIGESGPALEGMFRAAGLDRTERAATMDEAVATAHRVARQALRDRPEGGVATVLLSPAAASFDMFEDYAARGRAFIAAVARLNGEAG